MSFLSTTKRKILSACIAGFIAFSIVLAPVSQTLTVMHARAVFGAGDIVFDPANLAKNALTAVQTAGIYVKTAASAGYDFLTSDASVSLMGKEFTLDAIAWQLINIALSEMIQSTTRWVNSGFQGSPAFVTDLDGYLMRISDDVVGNFINGSALSFLCSPFKLNIQAALEFQYKATKHFETQCRLSQVVGNMQNFFEGDFLAGGWDGWFQMAMVPQNNPYGAAFEAQAGLYAGLQNARGQAITLADWGDGFLSKQVCNAPITGPRTCTTVTPGSVIQSQLNNTLNIPAGRLMVADEINELVGALLGQLVSNVMSGDGGLRGLTDSQYGRGDYFDRVDAETIKNGEDSGVVSLGSIAEVIKDESNYIAQKQSLLAQLNTARRYKNTTYGTSTKCASGTLPPALETDRQESVVAIASSTEVINNLRELQRDLTTLQNQNTPGGIISALLTKYQATKATEAQTKLLKKYIAIRSGGILHSPAETDRIKLQIIPETKSDITDFKEAIDTACKVGGVRVPALISTTSATSSLFNQ